MQIDNILDERIETVYTDLAGNPIYIGSTLSNPTFERVFDCYPGVVKVDESGRLYISCQSTKNKNGVIIRGLEKSVASKVLVIGEKDEQKTA